MKPFFLLTALCLSACGSTVHRKPQIFQVRKGDTVSSAARRLKSQGIIKDETILKLVARLDKTVLKRGNYEIPPQTDYRGLLKILSSGKGMTLPVTFPEGFSSFDMARVLEENNICSSNDFIQEIAKPVYLSRYNIPPQSAQSLEGYLFPDTYRFEADSPPELVVQSLLAQFDQVVKGRVLEAVKARGTTLHKALAMAAIIQKESGGNSEMRLISGVYERRLKIGMPMQADPTLIYALILDGIYDGNIRTKHLQPPYPHSYNTYYMRGLPPGPIANPGKEAILAALSPEPTSYLYFVGKGNGTHQFSKTLIEHNAAVKRYQLGGK